MRHVRQSSAASAALAVAFVAAAFQAGRFFLLLSLRSFSRLEFEKSTGWPGTERKDSRRFSRNLRNMESTATAVRSLDASCAVLGWKRGPVYPGRSRRTAHENPPQRATAPALACRAISTFTPPPGADSSLKIEYAAPVKAWALESVQEPVLLRLRSERRRRGRR